MDINNNNNFIPNNNINNQPYPFYGNQPYLNNNNNNFTGFNNFNNNNFNNDIYINNNYNNNNYIKNQEYLSQDQNYDNNNLFYYQQQNNNNLSKCNTEYQNNQNQNINTMYINSDDNNNINNNNNNNNINQNNDNNLNNNPIMIDKNKDNKMNQNPEFELESTPRGESGEIKHYLAEWDKEKEEEDKIKQELKKQQTKVYSHDKTKFSYNDFKKAPTTYIYKSSVDSNTMTYMTTVIHCLANIPPLAKYFLKNKKNFVKNMFKCPFNYYFSRFISNIYSYPEEQDKQFYQTFCIDDFKYFLIKKNLMFKGNSTKNAETFLNFFLQSLHGELNLFSNKNNKDIEIHSKFKEYYKELLKYNNSIIFDCFGWIQKKKIICTVNHSFIEFQNFFTYQLDIKNYIDKSKLIFDNAIKISDLIKFDLTQAPLYNINCNICKKKIKGDVTNFISISPNYFIFLTGLRDDNETLQKFTSKNINDSKEKYKFIIEPEINLEEIIPNNSDDYTINNSHKKYQLDALIGYNFDEQISNKISYIAYYRSHIDKSWYLYSHKEFKKIDEGLVLKTFQDSIFPSILIYSHK